MTKLKQTNKKNDKNEQVQKASGKRSKRSEKQLWGLTLKDFDVVAVFKRIGRARAEVIVIGSSGSVVRVCRNVGISTGTAFASRLGSESSFQIGDSLRVSA